MTPLLLYEHPLSPFAQKVKITLLEKDVPFEARLPAGIGSGARAEEDFLAENPRLEVPFLLVPDDDLRIFDSTVILEYLEDRFPEPALSSEQPAARARTRMIEEVIDTHYEAITGGLSEIRYFRRATGELAERLEARAEEELAGLHAWLEAQLGEAPWLEGESFGRADLCAVPFLNGAAGFGYGPAPDSALAAWLGRANERPSVARVREEATRAASGMSGVAELVEKGLFKRHYRDHRLEWMVRNGAASVVVDGIERETIRFTDRWG